MAMAQTILYGALETELASAAADRDQLWIPLDDLERATGWTAKPQGLCQGERCVPVPAARKAAWFSVDGPDGAGRGLDFAAFATHLGHAVARDAERGVWAFGPPADRGAASASGALASSEPVAAPDFRLPDLDGNLHSLSDYRGKKVLLYCWSSW
jgi:AhpC/TSA family